MNSNEINKPVISIVVPVFNEVAVIKKFHAELIQVLETNNLSYEVIYIDDHSTDGTFEWLNGNAHLALNTPYLKLNEYRLTPVRFRNSDYRRNPLVQDPQKIFVFQKNGKQGKAYSLIEGFKRARGSVFVMIDSDLQYPPSAIPQMIQSLSEADIVIANRKDYEDSAIRKGFSNGFRFMFGKLLFGLTTDIQSGLKVFTREVFETVKVSPRSGWTFDLEFLHKAKQAGFRDKNIDITFSSRGDGQSKINIIKTAIEIGSNALYVKSKKITPLTIAPSEEGSMKGAGVGYKGQKYITPQNKLPSFWSL